MALNAGIDFYVQLPPTSYYETPVGTIDGVNPTFTLSHTPSPPESLMLFKGGLLQRPEGNDYTLSGETITFVSGAIPSSGDPITAIYNY